MHREQACFIRMHFRLKYTCWYLNKREFLAFYASEEALKPQFNKATGHWAVFWRPLPHITDSPLPGFEPGSQAPEARVLSKLYYGGILYLVDFSSVIDAVVYTALLQHIYYSALGIWILFECSKIKVCGKFILMSVHMYTRLYENTKHVVFYLWCNKRDAIR